MKSEGQNDMDVRHIHCSLICLASQIETSAEPFWRRSNHIRYIKGKKISNISQPLIKMIKYSRNEEHVARLHSSRVGLVSDKDTYRLTNVYPCYQFAPFSVSLYFCVILYTIFYIQCIHIQLY